MIILSDLSIGILHIIGAVFYCHISVLYFGRHPLQECRISAHLSCLASTTQQQPGNCCHPAGNALTMATQIGGELASGFVFKEFGDEMGENDSKELLFS